TTLCRSFGIGIGLDVAIAALTGPESGDAVHGLMGFEGIEEFREKLVVVFRVHEMLVPVAAGRQLVLVETEDAGDAARPLRRRLALHPAPMAEPGELFRLAKLMFETMGFGNVARDAENAGDVGIREKIASARFDAPPAAVRMGEPNDLHDLRTRNANAFLDLLRDALPVVGMNEIGDPLPDQAVFGHAERLARGRALIGDGAFAIENGEDVARVLDERAIEVLAGRRADIVRAFVGCRRRRSPVGGTIHTCSPHPAFAGPSKRTIAARATEDARGICLTFS